MILFLIKNSTTTTTALSLSPLFSGHEVRISHHHIHVRSNPAILWMVIPKNPLPCPPFKASLICSTLHNTATDTTTRRRVAREGGYIDMFLYYPSSSDPTNCAAMYSLIPTTIHSFNWKKHLTDPHEPIQRGNNTSNNISKPTNTLQIYNW